MPDHHDLLEVRSVKRHYDVGGGRKVRAVDDVTLTLRQGETLALVGESGCGKSTLSRLMLRLEDPDEGAIVLDGEDVTHLQGNALRERRRDIQMIFQDPYTCLNPRMNTAEIVREPLDNFKIGTRESRDLRVLDLLQRVGLREDYKDKYPHELSGGQRQRLGIARALALEPKILLADEPVSALDVSIRAQVINLLMDLQREFDLSIFLVSHDIDIVNHISDRIAVMYLGKIVEIGEADDVLSNPQHPYTKALLDAVPVTHPRERRSRTLVRGDLPSPTNPPKGCQYYPRCPIAINICDKTEPLLSRHNAKSMVACHLVELSEDANSL